MNTDGVKNLWDGEETSAINYKPSNFVSKYNFEKYTYCDMHAVGQQSTAETLFITVAKQRNNGSDQRFLCGPFPGYNQDD
jgi:hypothetical protein